MKINKIKNNPNNPRIIKDDKFIKLCNSIKQFPKMMQLRPIIVDEEGVIQGGNMRYKALVELGYKEIPDEWVKYVKDFTPEEFKEFVIKDNVGFGEWDWNILANEWNADELNDWGLFVPKFDETDLGDFFEDNQEQKEPVGKIILEYTLEECDKVKAELLKHGKTPEDAVYNLLGL